MQGNNLVGNLANAVDLTRDHVTILRAPQTWVRGPNFGDRVLALSHRGTGLRKQPTPGGVPVRMRSPGIKVTKLLIHSMQSPAEKIRFLVDESWAGRGFG